jgi:MFS family permease
VLLGAVGAGAIGGAFLMPMLRARFDVDGLMLLAAITAAAVMAGLSLAPPQWVAILLLLVLGAGWITALTTLNGTAQSVLPNWVRGRSLAIYLTVFNGAMTAGSLTWGTIAEALGISATLLVAAAGLTVVGLVFHRLKLPKGEADLVPSNHWPEPLTASTVDNDRGPVLITVEYRVDTADRASFLAALHSFSSERRRDGAYGWGVTEDAAEPTIFLEWFFVESWAEHLRQHRRVSKADADLQQEVRRYHRGDEPPKVRHLLAVANAPADRRHGETVQISTQEGETR